jgi:hypothetical protein
VALEDMVRFPFQFLGAKLGRLSGNGSQVSDATGTIGLFENIREVKGGWWIVLKAHLAALWQLPYCLRQRRVCIAPDFRLPTL